MKLTETVKDQPLSLIFQITIKYIMNRYMSTPEVLIKAMFMV